ncbi:MAG: FecR family protein [Leptospirales bacterium]
MKKLKLFLPILASLLILVHCKEEKPTAESLHGTITFVRGSVEVNNAKATIGNQVKANDTINVKDKSTAVIQFSNSAMVTVEANTTLSINKLLMGKDGKPNIELTQERGSTFNKIMPGEAEYNIHTPTITAGVRGTSFSVDVKDDKTASIKLFRGKVAVKKAPKLVNTQSDGSEAIPDSDATQDEEIILTAGNKIEVSEDTESIADVKIEEMKIAEIESLEKLDEIAFVADDNLEQIETAKPSELEAILEEIPEIVPDEIEQVMIQVEEQKAEEIKAETKQITLDDLRRTHGQLSKVITKSGKVYIGAFSQKSGNMEIITTQGKRIIPSSTVAKVEPY